MNPSSLQEPHPSWHYHADDGHWRDASTGGCERIYLILNFFNYLSIEISMNKVVAWSFVKFWWRAVVLMANRFGLGDSERRTCRGMWALFFNYSEGEVLSGPLSLQRERSLRSQFILLYLYSMGIIHCMPTDYWWSMFPIADLLLEGRRPVPAAIPSTFYSFIHSTEFLFRWVSLLPVIVKLSDVSIHPWLPRD